MGEKICEALKGETSERECVCAFVYLHGGRQGSVRPVARFGITMCQSPVLSSQFINPSGGARFCSRTERF